jgi:hypothetical protein
VDRLVLEDSTTVALRAAVADATIHYTLDGSDPTPASTRYDGPIRLPVGDAGTVVTARAFLPGGKSSPPRSARITRGRLRDAATPVVSPADGLALRYVEGQARAVADLDTLAVVRDTTADAVAIPRFARAERWGARFRGFVRVPSDGVYTFRLSSDDGSRLWVGDTLVVDGDGSHTSREYRGAVALRAGLHPIRVDYFQAGGGRALALVVEGADGAPLPARGLFAH